MRLLLDTHAFVWAMASVSRLSRTAAAAIRDPENEVWLSAVSLCEIEYKRERDPLLRQLPLDLIGAADDLPAGWLGIAPEHAVAAGRLARVHRDPWDCLLAAQAAVEGIVTVSADKGLRAFGIAILW